MENKRLILKSQQRFKGKKHNVFTHEVNKIALSANDYNGKTDKYEYLADEETLPFGQTRMIEQSNFTYSSIGKTFEKQNKSIENQGGKQTIAI